MPLSPVQAWQLPGPFKFLVTDSQKNPETTWKSQLEDLFLSLGLWCQIILKIKALAHVCIKQSHDTSKNYLDSWIKHVPFLSKIPVCRDIYIYVYIYIPYLSVHVFLLRIAGILDMGK